MTRNVHTPGPKPRQIPSDLLALYKNKTTTELAEQFQVSRATISRWLKITRQQEDNQAT